MGAQPFNVAIVGYGMSAKVFHIPLVTSVPDLKLYGVVQRSPKPNDDASKDHPGIKSWRSVDEVYKDENVDIVVVTTIPEYHYEMVKDALEAGKHVVVEKPFVPRSKEADELVKIAKRSAKLLTVYQNRRWDADYLTVRKIISEGSLGDIAEFESHFDRHQPEPPPDTARNRWKGNDAPGHGSIFDLGTHLIDQVYHTFGMPKKVTGFVGNQRRGVTSGSHDSHMAILQYEGPLMVTVKAGIVSPEVEQLRFWVRGTKGSFKKFNLDCQEDQLKAGKRPGDEGFGHDPESNYGTLTTVVDGKLTRKTYPTVEPVTYVDFYRKFAKALHGQGDVPVKPEDARDCLRIIEKVLRSSEEGRTLDM